MISNKTILLAAVGFQLALCSPAIKAEDAPAVHTIPSPIDRVVVVRLKNKTDMLDGLKQAVEREKIKNAVIISGFGSVGAYHIHVVNNMASPYKNVFTKGSGPFDVLNVSGMVIDGKIHAAYHHPTSQPAENYGWASGAWNVSADIRHHHTGHPKRLGQPRADRRSRVAVIRYATEVLTSAQHICYALGDDR